MGDGPVAVTDGDVRPEADGLGEVVDCVLPVAGAEAVHAAGAELLGSRRRLRRVRVSRHREGPSPLRGRTQPGCHAHAKPWACWLPIGRRLHAHAKPWAWHPVRLGYLPSGKPY